MLRKVLMVGLVLLAGYYGLMYVERKMG